MIKAKFTTTIKRVFWMMKKEDYKKDGYFNEYKDTIPYWNVRLEKMLQQQQHSIKKHEYTTTEGTFLVGSEVNYVHVIRIRKVLKESIPEKYRGFMKTEIVWEIRCKPRKNAGW